MSEPTPTQSRVIALREERQRMREGYALLDEKCLLLAGEMLREVRAWDRGLRELAPRLVAARAALLRAIGRHGLNGLQVQPAAPGNWRLEVALRPLLGVPLQSARLLGEAGAAEPAVWPSPEAEACRAAHAALMAPLAELAALSGNLARLYVEHRRTVRRVRALQNVLLPEIDAGLRGIEAGIEELEQDEAAARRRTQC